MDEEAFIRSMQPGGPDWGWRTQAHIEDQNHVTIAAHNIRPDGHEAPAMETGYQWQKLATS